MAPPHHYVDPPDCPEGMTLAAWRAERAPQRTRRGLLVRLRRRDRRPELRVVAPVASDAPPAARAA
jgi:hypothetical protein